MLGRFRPLAVAVLFAGFLLAPVTTASPQQRYGFTGDWHQTTVHASELRAMGIEWPTIRPRRGAAGPVAAFAVGARDFGEPGDDPGFMTFTPFENGFFFGPKDVISF